MRRKIKQHIGLLMVITLWLAFSLWAWCKPADELSLSERRTLARFPELSAKTVLNSDFMEGFSSYAVDQFPLRDELRRVKAFTALYGFGQKDNNGLYIADDFAVAMEYPLERSSVDYAIARFNELHEQYLQESNSITFVIVPDKGFYLGETSGHLTMNYDALFDAMEAGLPWAQFDDITNCLTSDSYYRTDTHWRQERLLPVADRLAQILDISPVSSSAYDWQLLTEDFRGVYYGQSALPLEPDVLRYLTWPGWEDCTVYTLDTQKTTQIYDLSKKGSNDPYDIFLSGSAAIQTINNPHAQSEKELIVFRDSFGSSLVPLLVREYSTITLIDTRYISPQFLRDYVNFKNKDVLMLYSTLVLNSSGALRK